MHIFENFKNFEKSMINFFNPFTLLIGPNGSGKSNVIEGIELLSFIAHGRPLHEISDIGRGSGGIQIRGGLQQCPRYGFPIFTLSFEASIKFLGKNEYMYYSVSIDADKSRIFSEWLTVGNNKIFETKYSPDNMLSSDIVVEYNNFARGGKNPHSSVPAYKSILSQYPAFALKNKKLNACVALVSSITNYLRSSFIFDPDPKLMRTYNRIGDSNLMRNGANLSSTLYALSQGTDENKISLDRLLGWIKQLPDEPFTEFRFVTTDLSDVIFGLMNENGHFIDARLMSDGTLRCLAVLTALETAENNSRIIIEEFDNGLHPSRVHVLAEAIKDCCSRKRLNILVTTHNPATLNSLQDDQLDAVVLCVWNNKEKSAQLIKLSELPRFDELLERGRLGDLVTNRVIEKYFNSDVNSEYKEKALKWLESL